MPPDPYHPAKSPGNTDPILFGIEHEFFVFQAKGAAPSYETSDDIFQQLSSLLGGEFIASTKNHLYGLNIQTGFGPLSIRHEVSTHILEITFPPVQTPSAFRHLYDDIFSAINQVFSALDLKIVPGGMILELPPVTFPSVAHDDLPRIERRNFWLTLKDNGNPLFVTDFPASICSTQINLSIPDEQLASCLPRYYAMEYFAPLLFSTSRITQPISAHCGRMLRYEACMPRPFCIIPEQSPPPGAAYPWGDRDFSAIVPRGNHVEFRTACSQPGADRILHVAALRLLQHALAVRHVPITPRDPLRIFLEVCRTGLPPVEFFADLALLETCDLPLEWRDCAKALLDSARHLLPPASATR